MVAVVQHLYLLTISQCCCCPPLLQVQKELGLTLTPVDQTLTDMAHSLMELGFAKAKTSATQ